MSKPALLEKTSFFLSTVLMTTCAYAAIAAYGQSQGFIDIRVYSTKEQAYQAQLNRAQAVLAREAIPHEEVPGDVPQREYASVWAALDSHHKHR